MAEPRREKGRGQAKGSGRRKSAAKPKGTKKKAKAETGKPAERSPKHRSKGQANFQLIKALCHPLRVQILAILIDRIASPKEISEELNEAIGQVSYHVNVLKDAGLLIEDHNLSRRGAIEHFYRAAAPTVIPPGAWDRLPDPVRKGISGHIVKEFLDDACGSIAAGVFDHPPGELSWTPLLLDQTGVEEIGELARDFLKSVLVVQANASERLPKEKSERVAKAKSATVFLATFRSARSPRDDKRASSMKRR
jgi:DNA-binding transcriptional ArsR family regulator